MPKSEPWTVLLGKLKRIGWTEMQPDGSIRLNCDSPDERPTGDMAVATARMDGDAVVVDVPD
jgi:hypothetical protein